MAHINSECCVLLSDGTPCRREARYTCDNWHLVCATHRTPEQASIPELGCPICSNPMVQFSAIEEGINGLRRRRTDFSQAVSNFLREAAARWFPEFHKTSERKQTNDQNDER